jgi:hypothetical protein
LLGCLPKLDLTIVLGGYALDPHWRVEDEVGPLADRVRRVGGFGREVAGGPAAARAVRNALQDLVGEWPEGLDSTDEQWEWYVGRLVEVFGSAEAIQPGQDKMVRDYARRRVDLLREMAEAGHLPSMYLTARSSKDAHAENEPPPMTAEDRLAMYQRLHDYHFPLAAMQLARACWSALPELPKRRLPLLAANAICRMRPQMMGVMGDGDPYGPDPSPHH